MTVQYEFLFSVYSAPPFITEILMVLLVIVILGFPCTSYLSRYVPRNFVSPSETPPEVVVSETALEINELVTDEPETDTGTPEPGYEPVPYLVEYASDDSGPDDSSPDDSSPDDSGVGDPGFNYPGPVEPSPEEPGAEEPSAEEPGVKEPAAKEPAAKEPAPKEPGAKEPGAEEPGAEELGPVDPGGTVIPWDSDDESGVTEHVVVVDVHPPDRGSVGGKTQVNNTSDGTRKQGRDRSIQILFCKSSNYRDLSNSETEEFLEKYTLLPLHEYFIGDYITARNEFQRGEIGGPCRLQTENISTGLASRKAFKLQNLNAEKSRFLPGISRLKPYDLLPRKKETSSYDNSFTSFSSSPLIINKYKKKLADSMKMKLKRIRRISNQRYAERYKSHKSQQFLPCTEHISTDNAVKGFLMRDFSRQKQYELLTCKEETASQENSVTSVSSSPPFSNKYNSELDGSLKMKLNRIHQSSNRRYTERNAPHKSQPFVPCTEHSVTDHLEKDYFMSSHSHISKFHDWNPTKDVDDFSNLPSMNDSFVKQFPFTPTEGGDTNKEKYNYYNKVSKRRCCFESKESQDNSKERYETADWVQNNANGHNNCYSSAEYKSRYSMKDRYSHSESFHHSANMGGSEKFKSSSDINDAESTLSDKLHNFRIQEAKVFVELLKEMHYKNLRKKSMCNLKRKLNYYPPFPSDESATHDPLEKANEQNIGNINGKSISETKKVSELKFFHKRASKEKDFSSTDEDFNVSEPDM